MYSTPREGQERDESAPRYEMDINNEDARVSFWDAFHRTIDAARTHGFSQMEEYYQARFYDRYIADVKERIEKTHPGATAGLIIHNPAYSQKAGDQIVDVAEQWGVKNDSKQGKLVYGSAKFEEQIETLQKKYQDVNLKIPTDAERNEAILADITAIRAREFQGVDGVAARLGRYLGRVATPMTDPVRLQMTAISSLLSVTGPTSSFAAVLKGAGQNAVAGGLFGGLTEAIIQYGPTKRFWNNMGRDYDPFYKVVKATVEGSLYGVENSIFSAGVMRGVEIAGLDQGWKLLGALTPFMPSLAVPALDGMGPDGPEPLPPLHVKTPSVIMPMPPPPANWPAENRSPFVSMPMPPPPSNRAAENP